MSKKPKLTVFKESDTGLNTHFKTDKGKIMTRGEVADNIKKFPDHHIMKKDGKRIIRSNPDNKKGNNLG